MIWFVLFVLAWVSCGVISGMGFYAFHQNECPNTAAESRSIVGFQSWILVAFGPIGLLGGFLIYEGFRRGLKRFW